jgi:hypothetical protein
MGGSARIGGAPDDAGSGSDPSPDPADLPATFPLAKKRHTNNRVYKTEGVYRKDERFVVVVVVVVERGRRGRAR